MDIDNGSNDESRDWRSNVRSEFCLQRFLYSVIAWALIETTLFDIAAGFQAHVLNTALRLGVLCVALRHRRLWWSFFAGLDGAVDRSAPMRYRISDVTSCFRLVAAGCLLGLTAGTGSLTFFAIGAGAFNLVPWSTFIVCRRHFFTSCSMLVAGTASALIVTRTTANPFSNLMWAWFLWTYAVTGLLTTWKSDRPAISLTEQVPAAELQNRERAGDQQREKALRHKFNFHQ